MPSKRAGFSTKAVHGGVVSFEEGELYPYRKNVIWYKITRLSYDNFPVSLGNKLRNPNTVMELDRNDWEAILAYLT